MKSFDLNACGVMEMNTCEMVNVEGGNIFVDAAKAVAKVAETIAEDVAGIAVMIWNAFNNPQPANNN